MISDIRKNHKLVLLGDSNVGKTSFALRIKDNHFSESVSQTIGCEFFSKICDIPGKSEKIKLLIWDTSGQEVFRHFTPQFTRNTSLALIFFDINNNLTQSKLKNYIEDWAKYVQEESTILVIPTKYDLYKGKFKIDLFDTVEDFKNEIHIAHPVSNKKNIGIDNVLDQIIRILENKDVEKAINGVDFEEENNKFTCCRA